jgi:hypothetical protein
MVEVFFALYQYKIGRGLFIRSVPLNNEKKNGSEKNVFYLTFMIIIGIVNYRTLSERRSKNDAASIVET